MASTSQSAPLLRGEDNKPANNGAPVSRVSLILAVLAVGALFAVAATSTGVVRFPGSVGGTKGAHARVKSLEAMEKQSLEDITSELGSQQHLTKGCRAEIIGHQRIFVHGLEGMFVNGCGGPQFDPMMLKRDILREEGNPKVSSACPQEVMDRVFAKTFSRVYTYLCKSEESLLRMVIGLDATTPADKFDKNLVDKINLALASTEGLTSQEVAVSDVMSVEQANTVEAYRKLLAAGKVTPTGKPPSVVLLVKVKSGDMATSLMTMSRYTKATEQGLLKMVLQEEAVRVVKGSVMLGFLPPTAEIPDHFNRFLDHVHAMLGSAVLGV